MQCSLSLFSNALGEQAAQPGAARRADRTINRLLLEEILDLLTQEADRTVLMPAIMIDLDHFKRLND
jgi:hypothetical protein